MRSAFLHVVVLISITVFYVQKSYAQDINEQAISIRVENDTKFLISKLKLLGRDFENIKPGKKTAYVVVEPFFPSFKIDITIQRKRLFGKYQWYHLISHPIDHVGESIITNPRNTIVITIVKGEEKAEVGVETEIIKEARTDHN